jgi:hypothetical protein
MLNVYAETSLSLNLTVAVIARSRRDNFVPQATRQSSYYRHCEAAFHNREAI